MSEKRAKRGRGRPRRLEPAFATGYKATESTRRHLRAAAGILNIGSMQAMIDTAVLHYIDSLRAENEEFAARSARIRSELAVSADAGEGQA